MSRVCISHPPSSRLKRQKDLASLQARLNRAVKAENQKEKEQIVQEFVKDYLLENSAKGEITTDMNARFLFEE